MKVMQIIDSLEAGGAERMAVNYANALQKKIEKSYLCCTRKEGLLNGKINDKVKYFFLNKSSTIDLRAYVKLKRYISDENIDIVQAHSSSYFLAVMIKIFAYKKLKVVWHDHYGNSDFLEKRPKALLRFFSGYFDGIISVNTKLAKWAKVYLKCSNIKVIRNFLSSEEFKGNDSSLLQGASSDFKFICVANLRVQKDQLTLIKAFEDLELKNVSLHLIGKDFKDAYSAKVLSHIQGSPKCNHIFYYGSQENVRAFLDQADAGILSSISEGLPLALLEYGYAGLPVICTDVGQCRDVMGNHGILVPASNPKKLTEAMRNIYMASDSKKKAAAFQDKINLEYSESANLSEIIKFYRSI